jgi:hypothetical protein
LVHYFKIVHWWCLICERSFQAYEGSYNFKYGGPIDKKFDVKRCVEGDPMKAQLNLDAVYKTIATSSFMQNSSLIEKYQ